VQQEFVRFAARKEEWGVNFEFKIPFLFYDFYARVLPGLAFASTLHLLQGGALSDIAGWYAALLATLGYLAALVTQPVTGWLTGELEGLLSKWLTGDSLYVVRQAPLDPDMILLKMHAETAFFVQLWGLAMVIGFLHLDAVRSILGFRPSPIPPWLMWSLPHFLLPLGALMAYRRVLRAQRINKVESEMSRSG
jgi:hypothetical protein